MKIQKYNLYIYKIARVFLGLCPICRKPTQDKRYKRQVTIESCNIYRTSKTSVTMQCKQCGLHLSVTWKSLARAIAEKADQVAINDSKIGEYHYYLTAYHMLEKYVAIGGIIRTKQ